MIRKEKVQCCCTNLLWWYRYKCKKSALGNIPSTLGNKTVSLAVHVFWVSYLWEGSASISTTVMGVCALSARYMLHCLCSKVTP